MKKELLSQTRVTKEQREWLEKERAEVGESVAFVIRRLIQSQINKEAAK